jgi:hypothetical protein
LAQRSSRKRRKQRQRRPPTAEAAPGNGVAGPPPAPEDRMARGYARGRAKDEEARAALKPLKTGERPTAVTVGAIVAALAAIANLVALGFAYDPDAASKSLTTLFGTGMLVVIAVGMWRARYWAVLGLQALLAITMIGSTLALALASDLWAGVLAFLIVAGSGTLFWYLVKAMARIQMPRPPGADR